MIFFTCFVYVVVLRSNITYKFVLTSKFFEQRKNHSRKLVQGPGIQKKY